MIFSSSSGFLILSLSLYSVLDLSLCQSGQDAAEWLCADENCSEPIAEAVATKPYTPNDPSKIAVRKGDKLKIIRQIPPDSKKKLVYVESLVSKKRGLLPLNYIQEKKILVKSDDLIKTNLNSPSSKPLTSDINPSDISPSAPTTVIDGTTIVDDYGFASPYASFEPTQAPGSPSESVVQSTTPPSIPPSSPDSRDDNEVESDKTGDLSNTTPIPDTSINEKSGLPSGPSGNENAPELEELGISSTPASTIANTEPSLTPEVPKEADIVVPTTEVPSPGHESEIRPSQEVSDSPAKPLDEPIGDSGTMEGSGESLGAPDSSGGMWGGLTSTLFSLTSGSGEVEDVEKEAVADSPSDDLAISRGPNPKEEDASGTKEDAGETPVTAAELEDSAGLSQADTVDKRTLTDSGELPSDDPTAGTASTKEQPTESVEPEQSSLDPIKPQQGLEFPPTNQELANNTDPDMESDNKLADSGSQNIIDSTSDNKISDLPSEVSTPGRDTREAHEPTAEAVVSESNPDLPVEHTEETRVSMSSSQKTEPIDVKVSDQEEQPQESSVETSEMIVETVESSTEDIKPPVNDQVPQSAVPVEQPSVYPNAQFDAMANLPEEPPPSDVSDLKPEHRVDSERIVSTSEHSSAEEIDPVKDGLLPTAQPAVEDSLPQTTSAPPAPESPADSAPEEKSFGFSDLKFASPMEFVDPRKTNPDLYSTHPPSTDKPVSDSSSQWTATVEEVPLYNQWASSPPPSVPPADPAPSAPPSSSEQPSPDPSEVGPAPYDQPSTPSTFQEPDQSEEPSEPWYSGVFSLFGSLQEMLSGTSPELEKPEHPSESIKEFPQTSQVDEQSQTCQTDSCGAGEKASDLGSSILGYYETVPTKTIILMIVTAGAVLIFSLGYYFLENQQRDVELVSKYNELVGKLFIEQKEKETLLEQLASANESMTQISFDTTKFDEEIRDLKALVQKYKEEKSAAEEKEKEANRRRLISDKNYNDLMKTLSMHKQKGERSALSAEVKNLKDRIEADEINIASLKEQLLEKKDEIKSLNAKIVDMGELNQQLERKVEKAISEVHDNAKKYQDSISKLEKTIEENTASLVKLEAECTQLKREKESLAIEKELAESSLQKFQQLTPSNALTEWLNAKEVRVSLLAAEKRIKELSDERETLLREKKALEEKWNSLKRDLDQLNENYEKAEKDKIDALTKLQVLSEYFEEKETQLQEELGSKEALWLQKQSDYRSIYEQMRALREENTSFKNQNETLKREILEQEASYKKLIASANEKADEHWVALRHTERRLKEAQMEASQLRSRLSTIGAATDNPADKIKGEVNGDLAPFGTATSPQFMLYPHEFVPPPPLPTTTPSRPPPLGRISSPPPVDFVPPPPIIPFESLFLPPSPPPHVPHAMMNITHKPQPLDGAHHRTQKDSQSSNHSSESTSDKPRRNKR